MARRKHVWVNQTNTRHGIDFASRIARHIIKNEIGDIRIIEKKSMNQWRTAAGMERKSDPFIGKMKWGGHAFDYRMHTEFDEYKKCRYIVRRRYGSLHEINGMLAAYLIAVHETVHVIQYYEYYVNDVKFAIPNQEAGSRIANAYLGRRQTRDPHGTWFQEKYGELLDKYTFDMMSSLNTHNNPFTKQEQRPTRKTTTRKTRKTTHRKSYYSQHAIVHAEGSFRARRGKIVTINSPASKTGTLYKVDFLPEDFIVRTGTFKQIGRVRSTVICDDTGNEFTVLNDMIDITSYTYV